MDHRGLDVLVVQEFPVRWDIVAVFARALPTSASPSLTVIRIAGTFSHVKAVFH